VTIPTLERHLPQDFLVRSLRADAYRGLTATPKWLPPKWFYDKVGGELFQQITRLPEYYLTRAEREILAARAGEIAEITRARWLVELGSGSAEKIRLLLDALRAGGTLSTYVPVDVSESALVEASTALLGEYPGLVVHGVLADFEHQLHKLPRGESELVAMLGGTIGDLGPQARVRFLDDVRAGLGARGWVLLGTDLVKSSDVLLPAYDDAAGVTSAFNRNLLQVLNRELGADFDLDAFEHVAVWDDATEAMEMWLRSVRAQVVRVADLGLEVRFEEGEQMRTETSAKFTRERLAAGLEAAGMMLERWWTDASGRYALSLARPVR
jgi:L-histidine N-alpha-methyltransferase